MKIINFIHKLDKIEKGLLASLVVLLILNLITNDKTIFLIPYLVLSVVMMSYITMGVIKQNKNKIGDTA